MSFADLVKWTEAHPYEAAAIGGVTVLALLWLLGFFSGGSSSGGASQASLVSSFYGAEAAQAQAGADIQMNQDQLTAATAVAGLQANAAEAIATTQANAATTINGQNATAATALGADQLLATEHNADAAVATAQSNNATAASIAATAARASALTNIFGKLIPAELQSKKVPTPARVQSQIRLAGTLF